MNSFYKGEGGISPIAGAERYVINGPGYGESRFTPIQGPYEDDPFNSLN